MVLYDPQYAPHCINTNRYSGVGLLRTSRHCSHCLILFFNTSDESSARSVLEESAHADLSPKTRQSSGMHSDGEGFTPPILMKIALGGLGGKNRKKMSCLCQKALQRIRALKPTEQKYAKRWTPETHQNKDPRRRSDAPNRYLPEWA